MAADIRLTMPCALRQLRLRQVFFIPCSQNHPHHLIACFILIPFLFEMRREIIERRGILEYTLSLKKESLLNLLHLSIHRFHRLYLKLIQFAI